MSIEKKNRSDGAGSGCPEHEVVCAYFDGELDMGSPEALHIKSCPECQLLIKDFAMMAAAIAKRAPEKPSEDFADVMLKKVRTKIEAEKNPVIPFYMVQLMKAAAIFILIAGIFIYTKSSTDVKPQVTVSEPIRSSPPAAIASATPEAKTAARTGIVGEVQMKDLREVSTSPDIRFMDMMPQQNDSASMPVAIPGSVTQVWTVSNMDKAVSKARECMVRSGINADSLRFATDAAGMSTLSVDMNKKQLSSFVKYFSQSGFELLSAAQPQPEQNVYYGSAEDPVGYQLKLVPNGR